MLPYPHISRSAATAVHSACDGWPRPIVAGSGLAPRGGDPGHRPRSFQVSTHYGARPFGPTISLGDNHHLSAATPDPFYLL
jgi:hypothetical protein